MCTSIIKIAALARSGRKKVHVKNIFQLHFQCQTADIHWRNKIKLEKVACTRSLLIIIAASMEKLRQYLQVLMQYLLENFVCFSCMCSCDYWTISIYTYFGTPIKKCVKRHIRVVGEENICKIKPYEKITMSDTESVFLNHLYWSHRGRLSWPSQ